MKPNLLFMRVIRVRRRMERRRKHETCDHEAPRPSAVITPNLLAEADVERSDGTRREGRERAVLTTYAKQRRYRHLMTDVLSLLPHAKKDVKLDTKDERHVLNEVAEMKGCTSCMFFECRKFRDLYLWMAKTPAGPSVKFHVSNVYTMDELKLTGNHLKGSRPVLSFHSDFDREPHMILMKELFTQTFTTPKGHRKSKPFFDHVIQFSVADHRIWIRNYQVSLPADKKRPGLDTMSLVEVGPRLCLNPVKIFAGSFAGATLYENPHYVSPNAMRTDSKRLKSNRYGAKVKAKQRRKAHEAANRLDPDVLDHVFDE